MAAGLLDGALGVTLQGCNSGPSRIAASSAPAQSLNPQDEAARLIRTLDISAQLQDNARDHAVAQLARGVPPRTALERWISEQRARGAVIRCKAQVTATDECIART